MFGPKGGPGMSRESKSLARLVSALACCFLVASWSWAQAQDPKVLGFKKQFVIEIRNPDSRPLENYPVILDVNEIRSAIPDFNTYNYAFFEHTGGEYRFVPSQADDLDKDRYHDEIVFIRTLLPSSVTKLECYYSPKGSFQLMITNPKAYARLGGNRENAAAAWESNIAAFKFLDGRIEVYGKLYAGLILKKPPADDATLQEWGMDVLAAGSSSGLGGISLWEGANRIPLMTPGGPEGLRIQREVVAAGPLRALVRVEYSGIRSSGGEYDVVAFLSAFGDNAYSRQDVIITRKPAGPVVFSPGIEKLAGEKVTFDRAKGFLVAWGQGPGKAGGVGLAAIFAPADFAGLDEKGADRSIRLKGSSGKILTYWTIGGWERGIVTARPPAPESWARMAAELAQVLGTRVEVRFKAD
jgi:hypothetical protein